MSFYTLNLDSSSRWKDIVEKFKEPLKEFINILIETTDSKTKINLLNSLLPIPSSLKNELVSISEILGISYYKLFLYNVLLSSLVSTNSIATKLYPTFLININIVDCNTTNTFQDYLKKLVLKINVVKDSTIIYSTVTFAGFVGLLNAVSSKELSVNLNEGDLSFFKGEIPSFFLRNIMDSQAGFDDVVKNFKNSIYFNRSFHLLLNSNKDICIIQDKKCYFVAKKLYASFEVDNLNIITEKLNTIRTGLAIQQCHLITDAFVSGDNTIFSSVCIPKGMIASPVIY